jgi:hypothetical protein
MVFIFEVLLGRRRAPLLSRWKQCHGSTPVGHTSTLIRFHPKNVWPAMGLVIHDDGIIDDLQREYLPKAFRNIVYEGSKLNSGA